MNYIKLSFQYIKHNFWSTILYAIIPAAMFALFTNPCSIFEFSVKFDPQQINGFFDVYVQMNEGTKNWKTLLWVIASIIVSILLFSALIGNMQYKMRFGENRKIGFKSFFKKVNNNSLAVCFCMLVICLTNLLFGLINTAFAYFYIKRVVKIATVLMMITYVSLFVVLLFIACFGLIVLPLMTIKGYGIRLAVAESSRLIAHNFGKCFVALLLPVLIFLVPIMALSIKEFTGYIYVKTAVTFLLNAFIFTYFITLMYTMYFELEDVEREDLKKLKQWRDD